MTLRTLDLALWRRAEAREMALRPSFRLGVHNRAKSQNARHRVARGRAVRPVGDGVRVVDRSS